MKNLKSIDYSPSGSLRLQLSMEVAGRAFGSSASLSLADFTEEQQASASAALGWLAAQLGELELELIILGRWTNGTPAILDSETGEEITPATDRIVAAVQGRSAAGSTMIPQGELAPTAEISLALLALWDAIETAANS